MSTRTTNTNSGSDKPKLRDDLIRRDEEDGAISLNDPITNRWFYFEEEQADILGVLDGTKNPAEIAEEYMQDPDEVESVAKLVSVVDGLGLLESAADRRPEVLGAAQARALRPSSAVARDKRIAASVRWAHKHLPFYREHLAEAVDRVHGVADLPLLPITTKQHVRENFPSKLIPETEDLQDLVSTGRVKLATTSGSTGGRLQYIFDLNRMVKESLARHPTYAEAGRGAEEAKEVTFTTPICNGQLCHLGGIPFEERMLADGVLQLNSSERIMRMSREHIEEIISDIAQHNATVATIDPVYGVALVRAFQKYGLELPKFERVATGWEYLSVRHNKILSDAFGVRLYPGYGATDIGGRSSIWCENNRYHVTDDVFYFEFLRDGTPVEYGEIGEIAVTTLRHSFTRHIRYRVGDLARPIESCGCSFDDWPCFEFEGRVQDLLLTTSGEPVTSRRIDDLFEGLDWLDFYQLVQRDKDQFQLIAVRSVDAESDDDEAIFLERLRGVLGDDANVRVQYARELPIEQSFKYPPTKFKHDAERPKW